MILKNKVTGIEIGNANKFVKYELDRGSDFTWVCFLPQRTTLVIAQKYHLLPKKGNLIVYEVPLNLIADDPNITRKAFFSLVEDFESVYKGIIDKENIAFAGISVGSMPAIFIANKYRSKKIRIICSTAKLGEGIFGAFAARGIKNKCIKNGFNEKSYDSVLNEINPIKNIVNLPEDIKIIISKFDKYIPYAGGKKLAEEIRKNKKKAKVYKFYFYGHFLTMAKIGFLNKKCDFFK